MTLQIPTVFYKWSQPGHFSKSLAKGSNTRTWVWNFHADVHDFSSFTNSKNESALSANAARIFSAHFAHLGLIFLWLAASFYHGSRFSNYESWLVNPLRVKPGEQRVWDIVGQGALNADLGGNFQGIQLTSGVFHVWRSWGISADLELIIQLLGR